MQSLKKIHAWAQMKVPLSQYTACTFACCESYFFVSSKIKLCPFVYCTAILRIFSVLLVNLLIEGCSKHSLNN